MGRLSQLALFYPTLAYNVARNYLQPAYAWFNRIDDTLILGALPFKNQITELTELEGVGGVVCLNESFEMEHEWVAKGEDWEAAGVEHYWLPTPDFFYSRPYEELKPAVDFIRRFEGTGKKVYVHCKAGRTRSATVAACYLMDGHLLTKRAWDIALGPIKQVPMNLFMMYMAGSSISIFPIMMVGMMAMRPLKAMMGLKAAFGGLEAEVGGSLILQKLVFILGNLAAIGIAVYKCHSMGLLPTHPSDWLDFQSPPQRLEYAGAGVAFI